MEHYEMGISRFVDNELPPDEQKKLFSHLSGCEECREILADYMGIKKGAKTYYDDLRVELKFPVKLFNKVVAKRKLNIYKPLFYLSAAASIIMALMLVWNGKSTTMLKRDNYDRKITIAKLEESQNIVQAEVQDKITTNNTQLKTGILSRVKKSKTLNYNYNSMQAQYLKYLKSVKTINLTSADIITN